MVLKPHHQIESSHRQGARVDGGVGRPECPHSQRHGENDFSATERQTKRLLELRSLSYAVAGRTLFDDLDLIVTAGMRVGLVRPNGSGKTTLLRLVRGDLDPERGEVRRADALRIVYFDQNRQLDLGSLAGVALAPESDSVVYQDRVIHVASWAARFLFTRTAESTGRRGFPAASAPGF